jgi:hypothetical protein
MEMSNRHAIILSLVVSLCIVLLGLIVAAWPATGSLNPVTPSPTPFPAQNRIPGGGW